MTDPISIIAGVVGVAAAGIQSSRVLLELISDVKNAPRDIQAISQDAVAFTGIVRSLECALKEDRLRSLLRDDDPLIEAIGSLRQPLKHCQALNLQLKDKLAARLKPSRKGQGHQFRQVDWKWALYVKKDVKAIKVRLDSSTSSLNNGLVAITTLTTLRLNSMGKQDAAREIRRSSTATDAGLALKRYLAESITDVEDRSEEVSFDEEIENMGEGLRRQQKQRDELHSAAKTGDLLKLARLIAEHADIDVKGETGNPPVYTALENNNQEAASLLMSHGCNIGTRYISQSSPLDRKFKHGRTPLIWAAAQGADTVIHTLLHRGADINAQSRSGRYALQEAIRGKHTSTAKLLLDSGADTGLRDNEGWTALHQCADQGVSEVMKMLIEMKAPLDAITTDHNVWNCMKFKRATPLLIAIEHNNTECVQLLVDAGANLRAVNAANDQPIHVAARNGNVEILKLLLDAGIEVNETNGTGETALMKAIDHDRVDIVRYLAEHRPACTGYTIDDERLSLRELSRYCTKMKGDGSARVMIDMLLRDFL